MAQEAYDDVYATTEGWGAVPSKVAGEAYRYSVRQVGDRKMYFTEVSMPLKGVTLEALQAQLTGEWKWWHHGDFKTVSRNADGSVDFVFWPSPTPVVKLTCKMSAPQRLPDGRTRLFSTMTGTAHGAYYFDLKAIEGGVLLVSRQVGVPQGLIPALMGMEKFAKTHILSEIGEFGFPLPKGSGFVGLKAALGAS